MLEREHRGLNPALQIQFRAGTNKAAMDGMDVAKDMTALIGKCTALVWIESSLLLDLDRTPAGHTPLVALNKVTKGCVGKVICKMESMEPLCSLKDRCVRSGLTLIPAAGHERR